MYTNWLIRLAAYKFSSTQINLSSALAHRIIQWGKDNIDDKDVFDEEDNTGRESHIHITVKYGLHTNDVRKVEKIVQGFGVFDVTLGVINRFTKSDEFDVLKIAVDSPQLHKLHKLLSDNLENSDSHPTYQPHVTIAYIKKGTCKNLVGNKEFDGIRIKVNKIEFSPSSDDQEKRTISLV